MSARQFYIMLAICVITMKMQKMPCLVAGALGKDAWLLFLAYGVINIIGIILVFFILKRIDIKNVLKSSNNTLFNILKFILMLITILYFLVQAVLMYEHIHDLFANTLFDNLSWSFFSLFLLFAVFFQAHRGIENIGLNLELYTWIIIVPLIILMLLGVSQTDFSVILPVETIDLKNVLGNLKQFSCWFGDFFLILYLGIKAKDIKLSKTLWVYTLSILFMAFLVVVFVGIYDKTAPLAPGLISVISEQSLLDLSLGRVDWFLILFTEMGAILACSVNLYFANFCMHIAFPKAKPIYLKFFNAVVLYVLDVFLLVDLNKKINFFCGIMSSVTILVIAVTFLILFIIAISGKYKNKQENLNKADNLSKTKLKSNTRKREIKQGGQKHEAIF